MSRGKRFESARRLYKKCCFAGKTRGKAEQPSFDLPQPYCNPSAKVSLEVLGVFLALTIYTADEVLPGLRLIFLSIHVPVVPGLPGLGRLDDHLISSKYRVLDAPWLREESLRPLVSRTYLVLLRYGPSPLVLHVGEAPEQRRIR